MKSVTIWKLSTFCRFYGRVIPYYPNNNENEKFNSFHTYTRDTSVDDLNVVFEPNLKPMSFMDLVSESATNLYVMGHGNTRFDFSNRCYYESYTMYTKQGIVTLLQGILSEEKLNEVLHELNLMDQVQINLDKK
ncbi:hypothetical protein QUW17_09395, partial [Bacteroides gallinaceum]|uniref:hypothetical protein n=1 Tax=Bacteroides gallinaceum TaxID=1462571 RepID=UPI0025A420B7